MTGHRPWADIKREHDDMPVIEPGEPTTVRKEIGRLLQTPPGAGKGGAGEPTVFTDPGGRELRAWPVRLFNTAAGVPFIANVVDRGNGMIDIGTMFQVDLIGARAIRDILTEIVGG